MRVMTAATMLADIRDAIQSLLRWRHWAVVVEIDRVAHEAHVESEKLAGSLQRIVDRARDEGVDPLEVFARSVRAARWKRQCERKPGDGE
jgi:hypothetical protein